MKTKLYRIKIGQNISYSEIEQTTINYNSASKNNKKVLIKFIRSYYEGCNIRSIINNEYKAIYNNVSLIGVQYKLTI